MKVIDLSMSVYQEMPVLPGHAHTAIYLTSTHQQMRKLGYDTTFQVEALHMSTHEGTHVDTPRHCRESGPSLEDMPLEAFIGEGLCLDVSAVRPDALIGITDLQKAAGQNAGLLAERFIILHTGHYRSQYGKRSWYRHTGLSEEGARWLAEAGVRGVGLDAPSIDSSREYRGGLYPAHRVLLVDHELPVFENLVNLEVLLGRSFTFQALPLKLVGCGGSPVRAVAHVA